MDRLMVKPSEIWVKSKFRLMVSRPKFAECPKKRRKARKVMFWDRWTKNSPMKKPISRPSRVISIIIQMLFWDFRMVFLLYHMLNDFGWAFFNTDAAERAFFIVDTGQVVIYVDCVFGAVFGAEIAGQAAACAACAHQGAAVSRVALHTHFGIHRHNFN